MKLLLAIMLVSMGLPSVVQAQSGQEQFYVAFNGGTFTITGYTGSGGAVTIPDNLGLPVTGIGDYAFSQCSSLTSVTIPDSVTNIGNFAFALCPNLTSVSIGNGVVNIGDDAFAQNLNSISNVIIGTNVINIGNQSFFGCIFTNVIIPNSVKNIGAWAFSDCPNLISITIGNSVTNIGDDVFHYCHNLISVYFKGNAPSIGSDLFATDFKAIVYYLPGTSGWGNSFGNPEPFINPTPTALWVPNLQTSGISLGVKTNQFGFNISWADGQTVVVEACTNFVNQLWQPIQTNTLTSDSSYFCDPQWLNYPSRFYRIRSP